MMCDKNAPTLYGEASQAKLSESFGSYCTNSLHETKRNLTFWKAKSSFLDHDQRTHFCNSRYSGASVVLGFVRIVGSTVPFQEIISVLSHSGVLVPTAELALFPRVDATLVRRYGNPDSLPILS